MNILLKCAILILKIIYFFLKLFPIRNKITMISRQSNTAPLDFELLSQEIERDGEYRYVILAHKLQPGLKNKVKYIFHMFKQMYHIATSKVVILDTYCIVVSLLKHKKNLIVIQMWHAMGALKKFGYSVVETVTSTSALGKQMTSEEKKELSTTMKMHKGYDYIFASSEVCVPYFAEAFGYQKESMIVMPLPVVDILTDKEYIENKKQNIIKKYPILKDRKNIVYVPTFRRAEKEEKIQELIDNVDYTKYNLIIKPHPLTKLEKHDERVIWDSYFSSRDMLMIADYIISDYSAIIYEASLLTKPLYFYTYDYDDYVEMRNFYTDFKKELPGLISEDSKVILKAIEKEEYSLDRVKQFSQKYINQTGDKVCKRILLFLKESINKKASKK